MKNPNTIVAGHLELKGRFESACRVFDTCGVAPTIISAAKGSYVFEPCILRLQRTEEEKKRRHIYGDKGAKFRNGKQYKPMTDRCSRTITTFSTDNILMEQPKKFRYRIRKLTERECMRLMAVRDSDIDKMIASGIFSSQMYKLAGNSIVVDCLVNGIFKNLFIESDKSQDTLF